MTSKQGDTCSFCGKSRESVKKLIAGPNASICDGCVFLSYNIILAEEGHSWSREFAQIFESQLAALNITDED